MQARHAAALLLVIVPIGCSLLTGLDDFTVTPPCDGVEDCPGEDTDCALNRCIQGLCQVDVLPRYTPCQDGGEVCNEVGQCVLANGSTCQGGAQCASGSCVDGVCCNETCDADCLQCASGTCAPVAVGGIDGACEAPAVCDGTGLCTEGVVQWTSTFGSGADDAASGMAMTEDGVVVVGRVGGAPIFDMLMQPFGGPTYDAFTAKFDAEGNPVWINVIADPQEALANAVVSIPGGTVVHAGQFINSITLNGAALAGTAFYSIYLVALNAATGTHRYGHVFPGSGGAHAQPLALVADGTDVVLGGTSQAVVDFGTGPIAKDGLGDAVLVRFDGLTGIARWARSFTSTSNGSQLIGGVAVHPDGDMVVVGESTADIDFGGGPLASPLDTFSNPFVARLSRDGTHVWSQTFLAAGNHAYARGVAIDAGGDVYVAGSFLAPLVVGDNTLPLTGTPNDGYLAKLAGATGEVLWAFSFGGNDCYANDVQIDESGRVLVATACAGNPHFGSKRTVAAVGTRDSFIVSFTPDGELLWVRGLGAPGGVQDSIALSAAFGRIGWTGYFHTALSAPGMLVEPGPFRDPFVAQLTP